MPRHLLLVTLLAVATERGHAQNRDSLKNPERILAAMQDAQAKEAADQSAEAARSWATAVSLNPFLGFARYRLAQASLRVGDTAAAITALTTYVELGGGAPAQATEFGPDICVHRYRGR